MIEGVSGEREIRESRDMTYSETAVEGDEEVAREWR